MSAIIERVIKKVLMGQMTVSSDFGSVHKIVVCQRGFVYAGDVSQEYGEQGRHYTIRSKVLNGSMLTILAFQE